MEEKCKKYKNWLRVVMLIDYAGKQLCSKILHTKATDGSYLYNILEKYKDNLQYQIHEEILCPPNKVINENEFDLLIYGIVIDFIFGDKYDKLLDDVIDMRNEIFHMQHELICTVEFEKLWQNTSNVLCNHGFDTKSLSILKTCNLWSDEGCKGILDFFIFIKFF